MCATLSYCPPQKKTNKQKIEWANLHAEMTSDLLPRTKSSKLPWEVAGGDDETNDGDSWGEEDSFGDQGGDENESFGGGGGGNGGGNGGGGGGGGVENQDGEEKSDEEYEEATEEKVPLAARLALRLLASTKPTPWVPPARLQVIMSDSCSPLALLHPLS